MYKYVYSNSAYKIQFISTLSRYCCAQCTFEKRNNFEYLAYDFLLFGKKIIGFEFTYFWNSVNVTNNKVFRARPVQTPKRFFLYF